MDDRPVSIDIRYFEVELRTEGPNGQSKWRVRVVCWLRTHLSTLGPVDLVALEGVVLVAVDATGAGEVAEGGATVMLPVGVPPPSSRSLAAKVVPRPPAEWTPPGPVSSVSDVERTLLMTRTDLLK